MSSRVRDAVVITGVFAVVGAVAGVVWEAWWTPPRGVAYEGQFVMDSVALQSEFSATGSYVAISAALGLLLGVVLTALFDHDELVTLVAVAVGAVLAGWLMREVGAVLGPPDPRQLVGSLEDFTELPADLRVQGSAWVVFPAGALTGALVVLLGLTRSKV
ncbi:hypothetical protein [Nocardioides sp.]|uniref:hypothetical protein n=1 Tax=Nocardioides sp. TaxID=35761 RepID=UPI00273675F2|nr:hypothetical protein [Nocardioides sp.]MDP3891351.1 hypothetical protein [Nocardioides sp.]